MTTPRFTSLAAQVDPAQIRTAKHEGREHLVMPVVMLVGDAVVRPLNSDGPEFVPVNELAVAPGQWAGRPIVADHPANGTGSANEPHVLESARYGWVYSPAMRNGKLCGEAWLDPERAAVVGGDAERVVEVARRAMAGETVDPVEVSVGCWVTLIRENGTSPSGVPYEYRWVGVASDHLAVGLNGSPGACDVTMGCGAPRVARAEPTNEGRAAVMRAAEQEKRMNLPKRVLDALAASLGFRRAAEEEGQPDSELHRALWSAIYAAEPAAQWIDDVYQESQTVFYATAPESELLWWRRSYTVGEDGAVTLGDDREQVEPVMRYEPLAAKTDGEPEPEPESTDHPAVARAACGCQGKGEGHAAPAPDEGESMSTKVQDLVGRLIANAASPYTEDDKAHLEALCEKKLEALDAAFQPNEPAPEKAAEPEPAAEPDDSERISKEELADLRAAASAHKRTVAAQKTALVAKLKGAQDAYSEAELQALPVETLERIAKLAKVDTDPVDRDFSGRGFPVTGDAVDEASFAPPDTYGLVAAAKAKAATKEAN